MAHTIEHEAWCDGTCVYALVRCSAAVAAAIDSTPTGGAVDSPTDHDMADCRDCNPNATSGSGHATYSAAPDPAHTNDRCGDCWADLRPGAVQADIASWDAARAIAADGGMPGTAAGIILSPFTRRALANELPAKDITR